MVHTNTCYLTGGVILDRRNGTGLVFVYSILNEGRIVCGCTCVHTHTHTHNAQMGYSDVRQGVGMKVIMRHLEGPKIDDCFY